RSACCSGSVRDTRLDISSLILSAYGRAARIRSWARRNLAAATSFIARVIFCVDWTERIRRRISRSVAMAWSLGPSGRLDAPAHHEFRLGRLDGLGQRLADLVGDLLLVGDVAQELRVLPVEEGIEELLERGDMLHREVIEQALGAREDDGDLALD